MFNFVFKEQTNLSINLFQWFGFIVVPSTLLLTLLCLDHVILRFGEVKHLNPLVNSKTTIAWTSIVIKYDCGKWRKCTT